MIRILKEIRYDETGKFIDAAGLSSDAKPTTGLITGSRFTEVDTGDVYAFDEVGGAWHRIAAGPAPEATE